MFNKRKDASWYEIGIFDQEWKPISFATKNKILKIDYLGHAKFDVYINAKDSERTEYLCSTSKLIGDGSTKPMLETRICSRFK